MNEPVTQQTFKSRLKRIPLMPFLLSEVGLSGLFIIFSLYIFFHLAEDIMQQEVIFFDESVMQYFYALRTPLLTTIMQAVTFFGGPLFIGIATLLSIIYFWIYDRRNSLVFTFILLSGISLNLALKDLFHRARPTLMPIITENSYSFPSGHAMNSFIFYSSIWFFIFVKHKSRKTALIAGIIIALIILSIGLSRIYLGVHYPSDVLAGYCTGLIWFLSTLLFSKILRSTKTRNRNLESE